MSVGRSLISVGDLGLGGGGECSCKEGNGVGWWRRADNWDSQEICVLEIWRVVLYIASFLLFVSASRSIE